MGAVSSVLPLAATAMQGLVLGILSLPICIWVAYTDLSMMKIRNEAVLALLAVFVLAAPVVMPIDTYLWSLVHLPIVLAIGFVLATIGALGAGDAKFAAAMAPFVAVADAETFAILFAAILISVYVLHRIARGIPALRRRTADWKSWTERKDFPLGLALGPALIGYHALAVIQ